MIVVMETIRSIDNIKALQAGEVAIWGADISEMMEDIDLHMGLLSAEELKKAERLKNEQARQMCVLARGVCGC